jgi:2-alkyl-3-oxoalkanoate reductase
VRVLVTGASGLLGRSAAQLLMARGDEVTVLQRRPSGLACREVLGDIADREAVLRAVSVQEAVLHLAAKVDVCGRWKDYTRVNVEGTSNVVDACRSRRVRRLVHVSSPSVAHAGSPLVGVGAAPADPAGARGNYSRSKAIAELSALSADSDELSVLVIRPHLVWGPGDTQLVKPVVDRARQRRLPLVSGGAALVDTTYVDNAAAALVAALDACGPVHGEALVVSNGEPRPIKEILARLCAAAGVPGPTIRVPFAAAWLAGAVADAACALSRQRIRPALTRFTAEQMATAHWFDQRRSRDALNWSPHVSLDEGFARLAEWYGEEASSDALPQHKLGKSSR